MKLKFLSIVLLFLLSVNLIYAHQLPQVSYNLIEINGSIVKFINKQDGNSYFIFADNPQNIPFVIEGVKVNNNGQPCELKDFLKNASFDPVFFIAECKEEIHFLEISDNFLQNDQVDRIYFVTHNNVTETFIGTNQIKFNTTINQVTKQESAKESANTTATSEEVPAKSGVSELSIFLKYFELGVEHILTGPDHIFFIIGYILLSAKLYELLKGITGFTISHSATLTLAALGILVLPAKIVEPSIAVSVAVVAILAIYNIAKSWLLRFGIIFSFGLFHGLGFAGSIAEVGFPKDSFIFALFGFNLGIEAGQLLIVAILFPTLSYIDKKYPNAAEKVRLALACIVLLGGLYWLVERILLYY